jgi:hypothetical protein
MSLLDKSAGIPVICGAADSNHVGQLADPHHWRLSRKAFEYRNTVFQRS